MSESSGKKAQEEHEPATQQPSVFVHATLFGTYSPHIFMTDWMRAVTKPVFIWLMSLSTLNMIGIIFGIIHNDFAGYVPCIVMMLAMPVMVYVNTPYNGITKHLGVIHFLTALPGFIYMLIRLVFNLSCNSPFFCSQISYNNKRGLFIYLVILLILWAIALVFDILDIYTWYFKGDHAVLRSEKTLKQLISFGALDSDTTQLQVIQENHERPESMDKFGYKKEFSNV